MRNKKNPVGQKYLFFSFLQHKNPIPSFHIIYFIDTLSR